jgi:subtilase-type serine protease
MIGRVQPTRSPRAAFLLSLSCLALVAGCGGEDGGSTETSFDYGSPFDAPPPVDITVLTGGFAGATQAAKTEAARLLKTAKYKLQKSDNWTFGGKGTQYDSFPLRSSGAAFAHAAGLSGVGSLVVISDEKITEDSEIFGGRLAVLSNFDEALRPSDRPKANEHGTVVAAVIGGESDTFIGTAPGATLVFGTYQNYLGLLAAGEYAKANKAVAWNNSWGIPDLSANKADLAKYRESSPAVDFYLDVLTSYAEEGVVVFAIANEKVDHSTLLDGLPYLRPELEAGWIAAANGVPQLSASGDVTSVEMISSNCNEAARWCLVADGAWTVPKDSYRLDKETDLVTGSSFAAPQISGALALLDQAFPELTPHQLRVRLLASADDKFKGFKADGSVELAKGFDKDYSFKYGHGFLDIEAALKPIGDVGMKTASGEVLSTDAPALVAGSALGDALDVALADTDVSVQDQFSGNFVMPAVALAAGSLPEARSASLLARSLGSNLSADRKSATVAIANPFGSFRGETMSVKAPDGLTTASVLMPQGGSGSVGLDLTHALTDGPTRVEVGLKVARDGGGTLSLSSASEANFASVALGVTQDFGNAGFFALAGEVGKTDLGGATALTAATTATFNSVSLKAGARDLFSKGDKLTFGVGMPVAVSSGSVEVSLPVIQNASAGNRSVAYEPIELDLAPQDRQMDMEISYQTALSDGVEMKMSVVHSDNFGNRAGETDTGGALALTFRF